MIERLSQPFLLQRDLAAPCDLVFAAYTQAEHLQRWMSPAGMTMSACRLDARPGGVFHYGLRAAAGPTMWGRWTFREIVAPERLVVVVEFSDADGGVTRHPMAPSWPLQTLSTTSFTNAGAVTTVRLEWRALNAGQAEEQLFDASHASLSMGCGAMLDQLTAYLAAQQRGPT